MKDDSLNNGLSEDVSKAHGIDFLSEIVLLNNNFVYFC